MSADKSPAPELSALLIRATVLTRFIRVWKYQIGVYTWADDLSVGPHVE
jgi:hypothetical protein